VSAPDAAEAQRQAAAPDRSTWLSANAGSGKTRVLIERVARLLLDGAPPETILCLTYTNAAAREMENRLVAHLGHWTMAADEDLRAALRALGVEGPLTGARLAAARRLFARAIETPGGLRIQTIHGFCAGLLRRFPLEAGVSPGFTELDEAGQGRLIEGALDRLAEEAPEAFDALALAHGGEITPLAAEIAARREAFAAPLDGARLQRALGLPEGYDEATLLGEVFSGDEPALWRVLLPALEAGSTNDAKAAGKLREIDPARPDRAALEALEGVFLYGEKARAGPFSAKIGAFPTKGTRAALGPALEALEALMERVGAARERRLALDLAERCIALHGFARPFLARYTAGKATLGALDFDDLIFRARDLLADEGRAAWVLYRLDGEIRHLLIDEAQDTSPAQWKVLDHLTREFGAGHGTRPAGTRTVFVVGDPKQSIYSFQGADPDGFAQMATRFGDRLAAGGAGLARRELLHSFRTAPAILRVVDATFGRETGGLGAPPLHMAHFEDMPGRVDLWPAIAPAGGDDDAPWHDPVDRLPPEHHTRLLARAVAERVEGLIGTPLPGRHPGQEARAAGPGDVLILLRRRSRLFHEILRALKARGLAVAGADRMRLMAEIAVRDLEALLRFLALPEDDLSLAAALRSPLFGLGEETLYELAHGRDRESLWQRLVASDAHETARAALSDLLEVADFLRPFEVLERILVRHDGRRRLIARLGDEAAEGIDALLARALGHERDEAPSLTGFIAHLERDRSEVKRQIESAGARIRVMTVHGAKGLEAPVVILPETEVENRPDRRRIVPGPAGIALLRPPREASPPALRAALDESRAPEIAERDRLLYVAMTRAAQWLIVAAAGDVSKPDCWYRRVEAGMEAAGAVAIDTPAGAGRRVQQGAWPEAEAGPADDRGRAAAPAPLPGWALRRPPAPPRPAGAVAPSALGGAKALAGEGGGAPGEAERRGSLLHLLLEHLPGVPRARRAALARGLLAGEGVSGTEAAALLRDCERVLCAPGLAPVFGPGSRAEAEISASLPPLGGRRVRGRIDRLIVAPDRVLAVDFKSNAVIPGTPEEVPEGLLRQMGAYAAALSQVFPGRRAETALLWTAAPRLMLLPAPLTSAALTRAEPP